MIFPDTYPSERHRLTLAQSAGDIRGSAVLWMQLGDDEREMQAMQESELAVHLARVFGTVDTMLSSRFFFCL
jgi:hypothetical protein